MIDFHIGRFGNIDVVAAFSGVCKVNAAIATQIMIDRFDVSQIILSGVAGALSDSLQVGDIVIGTEIAYHDVAREILTEYHPWMPDIYFKSDKSLMEHIIDISKSLELENKCHTGRIITGEKFITENERYNLIETFEPLCVDMESASVAHVCYANNIPFIVIRSMSDFANEDGSESFEDNMEAASLNSLSIVEELLKRLVP
jgi:adenosylhomocysteine nucleosidase